MVEMKHGDPVEVHKVWAGGSLIPLKSWFKGYEFVREGQDAQGAFVMVRHTEGFLKGVETRWPPHEVRQTSS